LHVLTKEPQTGAPDRSADLRYQENILQGVSRTFALTIPQLPERLRMVVGNAYLLCRIADTIEDSSVLSIDEKVRYGEMFVAVVRGNAAPEGFGRELAAALTDGCLDAERDLVRNTPAVIRLTHSFRPEEREALTRCVRIMSDGMEDFQEGNFTQGLRDVPHLDAYCYHVAGVVGEMLCALFCAHSAEVEKRRDELERLAVSFGQGLQMTNILKDIWDDKERNVIWLPRDVFEAHGFDLRTLRPGQTDPGFRAGLRELVAIAHGHLENALAYTMLIPRSEIGIRRFCLWALFMAVFTLRRVHANPDFASGSEVKISRRTVKTIIAFTNFAGGHDWLLKAYFRFAGRGLPKSAVEPR
jgi:farnesyl-diphosphate farnesyltransferase